MSERLRADLRTTGAIRTFAHRFAYVGLVISAVALMMLGKADSVLMEKFRIRVIDTAAPILDLLSRPVDAVSHVVGQAHDWIAIREENVRLREDRAKLMQWQTVARRLETENAALKQLLNFVPEPGVRYVTARVIADSGGAFAHSLLLSAGSQDGVRKGQPVVAGEALVGRIAEAASHSAQVLLITDLNSRIPVLVGPARTRAILAGKNSDQLKLDYLVPEAVVSPSDLIVTSGHAGVFPQDIPVGVVASIKGGEIKVNPYVDRNRLEYVRVVDYELSGILSEPMKIVSEPHSAPPDAASETESEPEAESEAESEAGGRP